MSHLNYRRNTIGNVHFTERPNIIYESKLYTSIYHPPHQRVLKRHAKLSATADICSHDHKSLYSFRRLHKISFRYLTGTRLAFNIFHLLLPDLLFIVFFIKHYHPPNLSSSTLLRVRVLPSVCRSFTLAFRSRSGKFIH